MDKMVTCLFVPGDDDKRLRRAAEADADEWTYAQSRIVNAAGAQGLRAIDGPYARLRDPEGFVGSCARAAALGFAGKLLIHPEQLQPCRRAFAPTEDEVAAARALLHAGGVTMVDGAMVDAASARAAQETIADAEGKA